MRTFLALIAGFAFLSAADAWSQTPAEPERDAPSAPRDAPSTEDGTPMDADAMQQRMLRMHEVMHEALDARDPAERRRKMQEHQELMRDMMRSMQSRSTSEGMHHGGMHDGDMMGGDMMGGGMMGEQTPPEGTPAAGAAQLRERVEALEQQVQQLEQQLARLRAEQERAAGEAEATSAPL